MTQTEESASEDKTRVIRAKWACDGAQTLAEAAAMLRAYAERLESMAREGWELESAVEDDYGFAVCHAQSKKG